MIEVRIIREDDGPSTGRCAFCWQRLNEPQPVQAVVFEDGEPWGGLACPECLALDDAALRERIRQTADVHEQLAADLREMAAGVIQRPHVEVLQLERLADIPSHGYVIGPITG